MSLTYPICYFLFLHHVSFPCSLSLSRQVDQIQAEFKILALQYHPDKNDGDKESEAKFQQLKVRDNDDDKQNDGNDKHL